MACALTALSLTACGGGGGGGASMPPVSKSTPSPTQTQTPSPTPTPTPTAAPTNGPMIAVAGTSGGPQVVNLYHEGQTQPAVTLSNSFTWVSGFAADKNNNLFVLDSGFGNSGTGNVTEYAPPYTSAPIVKMIPGFGSNLNLFALNPSNGDVFVSSTDYSNGVGSQISMFGPPYTGFVTLPAPAGIAFAPACLMLDANGNLFVANTLADGAGNYLLFEYTPPYTAAPTALPTGVPPVNGVPTCAIDKANGDVFVGNASQTAMYAPPYTTETTLADGGFGQGPLTVDPTNGNLFMASPPGGTSEVDVLAPPYNSITTKITNGLDFAEIVALDPSENLFVANGNNTVTEYAPPYTGAPISTFNVNFTHSDIMALGIVP